MKLLRFFGGLAVAIVVIGVAFYFAQSEPGNAKVGDCVAGASAENLEIVDCKDDKAEWKVVGRVEDKPESAMTTSCTKYKKAEQAFWQGEKGENGLVLCLAPVK